MSSDQEIISAIINLHNNGNAFDVDPTYSKGVFWKGLETPKYKFDINPQVDEVQQASATDLPLEDSSVNSVMFDPPFVVRVKSEAKGIIHNRFSSFTSIPSLWEFYRESLKEFYRILKPSGIVAFKCQDTIDGGKEYWSHFEIMKYAFELGYKVKDTFILYRGDNVLFSPNMKIQKHARKTHCYYLVLEK
jgi:tRNA G10  N-methylase Trm11